MAREGAGGQVSQRRTRPMVIVVDPPSSSASGGRSRPRADSTVGSRSPMPFDRWRTRLVAHTNIDLLPSIERGFATSILRQISPAVVRASACLGAKAICSSENRFPGIRTLPLGRKCDRKNHIRLGSVCRVRTRKGVEGRGGHEPGCVRRRAGRARGDNSATAARSRCSRTSAWQPRRR